MLQGTWLIKLIVMQSVCVLRSPLSTHFNGSNWEETMRKRRHCLLVYLRLFICLVVLRNIIGKWIIWIRRRKERLD